MKSHPEIEVLGQVQRTRALFPRDVLDAARARFMGRKAEAYRVLHDAVLDEGGRRRIQEYLDGFFNAIGSDTAFYRPVVARPNTINTGVGIMRGASDRSPTVRTFLADGNDAEKILLAARGLRERAGTLTGMAAGQDMRRQPRDVLGDVLSVFAGEPGLHWPTVAERLARRYPDRWADVSAEAISAQCRDLGVPSVGVKIAGVNLNGCRRDQVEEASRR